MTEPLPLKVPEGEGQMKARSGDLSVTSVSVRLTAIFRRLKPAPTNRKAI